MINVTTRINAILETSIVKPPTRNRWSRRAIARYLGSQGLLGSDKNTIAKWEVLLRVVKDYRDRIPKDAKGNYLNGYPLDQYQFACMVKLAYVMTELRHDLNGGNYMPLIARTLAKPVVQDYFSLGRWLEELGDLAA